MSKRIGTLHVSLVARTDDFSKGMAKAAKDVEKVSKKIEEVGKKATGFAAALTAPIVGALKVAEKFSPEVEKEMKRVSQAFEGVAVQIAQAVLPVVHRFADAIASLGAWIRDMDPATKEMIVSFAETAVKLLALTAAVGQAASMVSTLAKVAGLIAPAFTAPVLIAVGAIVAIIVIAAVLRKAWEDNLGGIREKFAAVWKWITDKVSVIKDAFKEALKFVVDIFAKAVGKLADLWVGFGKMIGQDFSADFLKDLSGWIDSFNKDNSIGAVWDDFKDAAAVAIDYVKDGLRLIKGDLGKLADGFDFGGKGMLFQDPYSNRDNFDLTGVARPLSPQSADVESMRARAGGQGVEYEGYVEAQKKLAASAREASDALVSKFTARLGRAGDLMETASQGFQAGGIWGAIIGVAVDLFTSSKQFQAGLAVINEGLDALSDLFGRLFASGEGIFKASQGAIDGIVSILGPIFDLISDLIGVLEPITQIFSDILGTLGELIGSALKPLFTIIKLIVDIALKPLMPILKVLALIILGVSWVIGQVVNAIIQFVAWIVEIFDGEAAAKLRASKMDTDGIAKQMDELWNSTSDVTKAQEKQTAAVKKTSEALLNMPEGFKVTAARFAAINAEQVASQVASTPAAAAPINKTRVEERQVAAQERIAEDPADTAYESIRGQDRNIPKFAAGGVVTSPTLGLIGEAGPEAVVPLDRLEKMLAGGRGGGMSVHFHGITDAERIWSQLKRLMERDGFRGAT